MIWARSDASHRAADMVGGLISEAGARLGLSYRIDEEDHDDHDVPV